MQVLCGILPPDPVSSSIELPPRLASTFTISEKRSKSVKSYTRDHHKLAVLSRMKPSSARLTSMLRLFASVAALRE